ncbi:unnamed protein product [Caenorhabditis auriculariae]|uniref:Uncharacterized protein n=1 Tax=Caenorhabditis auriculariae TaxID=2777116 RepID=A0A8S1HN41_9PELO|nr:unnamed protein product [Caenorhabditis auriculariae]
MDPQWTRSKGQEIIMQRAWLKSSERSGVSYKSDPNAFRSRSKSPSVNPVPQFSSSSFGPRSFAANHPARR